MLRLGFSATTVAGWVERGYLIRVLPKVYALGHTVPSREGDLWAAVLYAGPGAGLSHATGTQWCGLIEFAPKVIEVTTPRKIKSIPGVVRVYGRRSDLTRVRWRGIPVISIPEMMVDLAATADIRLVRKALANLDYRGQLDYELLRAACVKGKPGSNALRSALAGHQPKLAHANGPLEETFVEFCERWRLPIPRLNVRVHGILVDAYWPAAGLVVELDGHANHSSPAQRQRDRRRDLDLRTHGLTVLRYDWALLRERQQSVYGDIVAALG
jgi:hypothetical protein